MYNYFVYCAWIEQALDFMIVWIWCTHARVPEVHVILADLPCVPYMNCTSPGFLDCVNMYTLSWPIFLVYRTWIVQALDSLIVWICTRYPGRSSLCTVHELYKSWIPWLCEHVHLASKRYSPLSRYPIYTLYANWEFWTDSQTLYRDRDNKRKHWHFYINLSISSFLRRGLVRLNARTFVQEVLNIKYRCVRALLACSCENQGERGGGIIMFTLQFF